jgi:hypothetical protein
LQLLLAIATIPIRFCSHNAGWQGIDTNGDR